MSTIASVSKEGGDQGEKRTDMKTRSISSGVANIVSPEKKSDRDARELLNVGFSKFALKFAIATEKLTATKKFKLTPSQSARNALSERVKVRSFDIF